MQTPILSTLLARRLRWLPFPSDICRGSEVKAAAFLLRRHIHIHTFAAHPRASLNCRPAHFAFASHPCPPASRDQFAAPISPLCCVLLSRRDRAKLFSVARVHSCKHLSVLDARHINIGARGTTRPLISISIDLVPLAFPPKFKHRLCIRTPRIRSAYFH